MKKLINNIEKIPQYKFSQKDLEVTNKYPFLISDYYLGLIDMDNISDDPIAKQCFPNILEIENNDDNFDPLCEEKQSPLKRMIHRYEDRVVIVSTNRCAVHCRFCFRKRNWINGEADFDITEDEIIAICAYLQKTPKVHEVLISGGDPFMLTPLKLDMILERISKIENIDIIRIGSRIPVVMPSKITDELIKILKKYPKIWLLTHFNHPKEVTKESMIVCNKLQNIGIPILNQTVLLKDINNSGKILEELFRELIKNKIIPHYLFHIDPVKSVRHFATGIDEGLEILRSFKNKLSSLAVPTFAIDLPEGGGKVALQPNYKKNEKYLSIDNHYIAYKI